MGFWNKVRSFFYGRYGIDGLYYALLTLFLVFWIARLFSTNLILSIVLLVLQLASAGYMFFRCF